MRYLVPLLLAVVLLSAAVADQAPLALSKCLFAVKLTNPDRIFTQFAPVLDQIDTLADIAKPGNGKISGNIAQAVKNLEMMPGVNAGGDFWELMLPPSPPAAGDPTKTAPLEIYVLLPLTNKALMQNAVKTTWPANLQNIVQLFDNFAVFSADPSTPPPNFSKIVFDQPLSSKRDIVIISNNGGKPMPTIPSSDLMTIMSFFGPIYAMGNKLQQHLPHLPSAEIGVAMVNGNVCCESFATPAPDSAVAQQLAAPRPTDIAGQLAGYLPDNLSLCVASGPSLLGMPGAGALGQSLMDQLTTSINSRFGHSTLNEKWAALTALCSHGYALGITSPAADQPTPPACLLGIMQTDAPDALKDAVTALFTEAGASRDSLWDGLLSNVLSCESKAAAEMDGDVPVDLVTITLGASILDAVNPGAAQANKPYSLACRFAYLPDKCLFAIGEDSQAQMAAMITRIQQQKTGFTASRRFAALKALMPDHPLAFGSIAPAELLRAVVTALPDSLAVKESTLNWLKDYPYISQAIFYHLETSDGKLHSDTVFSKAQLTLLFTALGKAATQLKGM